MHNKGLGALASDASGQLNVFGHDSDAFGVNGAEVGVLEERNEVRLRGLLQRFHGRGLEAEVVLEVLCDLPDQPLEGQLSDQKVRGLLVPADLPKGHCAGPVAVRLLHASCGWCGLAGCLGGQLLAGCLASCGWCGLAGCLGGQLLAGCLASGGLAGGLFGACH
ncbi:hypothetical protein BVRB_023460 [Beta vulgaris subsp. vulgaris]|uniref:Uncharacterized protein n=1 Tax=Beta vulgaris subsp. vulgaris TaxID=3555 RepID=A0A0J8AZN0_BETVV|nr:hypothetical protein BVRB_023460 [Beta vulgaris subsp. vulgaris]